MDLTALDGSINKWKRIVEDGKISRGTLDCPLCHVYWEHGCRGCPIYIDTKKIHCDGTPHGKYCDAVATSCDAIPPAKEMLDYLIDLRRRLILDEALRFVAEDNGMGRNCVKVDAPVGVKEAAERVYDAGCLETFCVGEYDDTRKIVETCRAAAFDTWLVDCFQGTEYWT